jgi:3-methyl-2-oxobutanoate hydroxymethyltransferase
MKSSTLATLKRFSNCNDSFISLRTSTSSLYKHSYIPSALSALSSFSIQNKNHGNDTVYNSLHHRTIYATNAPTSNTHAPLVGPPLRKKITIIDVQRLYKQKKPLTVATAYSYPSAVHVDAADIDMLLVGDSVGMVELGYDTTQPVTMDEMLHHAKAVSRGATRPLLIGDMPFGSYETDHKTAYNNAIRFLKEAGMDAVKLEGGKARAGCIRALVDGGVSVMGHIGLTPQHISVLGGFRAQGKTVIAAKKLIEDALALQEAGCFAIVIECVPSIVAKHITEMLQIPTIGIGAGPHTSGQVLVYHDMLGFFQHAHNAKVTPSFSKKYADIGDTIQKALIQYKNDVENGEFPTEKYSPYKMSAEDQKLFEEYINSSSSKAS